MLYLKLQVGSLRLRLRLMGDELPPSKPDGFASSLPEGASGETGHFAVQPGCAVKRFKMASACALAIISGRNLYNFGIAERLRALRYPIFTGGVVEGNGICSAAFCESAALRLAFSPSPSVRFAHCHLSQRERQEHYRKLSHYT